MSRFISNSPHAAHQPAKLWRDYVNSAHVMWVIVLIFVQYGRHLKLIRMICVCIIKKLILATVEISQLSTFYQKRRKNSTGAKMSFFYTHPNHISFSQLTQYQLALPETVFSGSKTERYCLSRFCSEITRQVTKTRCQSRRGRRGRWTPYKNLMQNAGRSRYVCRRFGSII
jgi:hypothetical protein